MNVLKVVSATLLALLVVIVSCNKDNDPDVLKVGLVSGTGGFTDRGFNQLALNGLTRAQNELDIVTESRECFDTAQIREGIEYFASGDFNLIITLGYESTETMLRMAKAHPDKKFALIDDQAADPPSNLHSFLFRVDQSSFLCGVLGAYWADLKDPVYPLVGWVAGPQIDEIEHFRMGFFAGIEFFNSHYSRNVENVGNYTSSFIDTLEGATLANALIVTGAEIIFPFAGKTGNGALYKAKELGKWAIGVDLDQYESIPEVRDILISSCLKKLDNTVYELIKTCAHGDWGTEQIHYGTWEAGDVDIAPFHDYESQIPDSIKALLETVKTGIKEGNIQTGWNP